MGCDPGRDGGRGLDHTGRHPVDLAERAVAVQMGIDGDDTVEHRRHQRSKRAGRDGFARVEAPVLTQVRQVRGSQQHAGGAEVARCVRGEQQGQRLGVRLCQAGHDHDGAAGDVGVQPHQRLAVREPVQLQGSPLRAQRPDQSIGEVFVARQVKNERFHRFSEIWKIGGRERTNCSA